MKTFPGVLAVLILASWSLLVAISVLTPRPSVIVEDVSAPAAAPAP